MQEKLEAELPDDALVVAGRFPFPDWKPCRIEGQGVDRAWAYSMQAQRQHTLREKDTLTNVDSDLDNEVTKEKLSTWGYMDIPNLLPPYNEIFIRCKYTLLDKDNLLNCAVSIQKH